jgi:hypothetical protein
MAGIRQSGKIDGEVPLSALQGTRA